MERGVGQRDVHEDEVDGAGADEVEDGVAVFLEDAVDAAGEFENMGEDELVARIVLDGQDAITLHGCSFKVRGGRAEIVAGILR